MTEQLPTRRGRSIGRRLVLGSAGFIAGGLALGVGVLASRKGGALLGAGQSRARAVAGDAAVPAKADVVVIGAGNIGCFAALALAERDLDVVLCEKGVVAGEASGRSLGYIDGQFIDPVKAEIIARSKQLWRLVDARIGGSMGYSPTGLATVFADAEGVAAAQAWLASVKGFPGVDAQVLGPRDANALFPGIADTVAGALVQPSDAIAEPTLAAPAIAEHVRKLGGKLLQNCAVRGVETRGGRISGVVTERGTIACSTVILAGGVWSPIFARSLGLHLPQFMAFGTVGRVIATGGSPMPMISTQRGVVFRPNNIGGYDLCRGLGYAPITPDAIRQMFSIGPALRNLGSSIVPVLNGSTFMTFARMPERWALDGPSPFETHRILVPETMTVEVSDAVRDLASIFPAMKISAVAESWAGALTSTPDNMPIISPVSAYPGLIVGSGFYFGLTMAPAAGEALADLAMGRKPGIDLTAYRFDRFNDGSPLVFRA